jgi:tetratricopeptide (TPR) repeat protein
LRDLGAFAGEGGDVERAKTLFAQAQDHARRIQIPPQRFELLASIAKEYTRIGLLQEARDIARASGSPGEAQAQIAEGLLQSGKIAAALEAIAECENAATDRQLARLAYALLAAGEFERASSLVARIADPLQRAEGLVQVARSHISAGRLDEARKALARAVELSRTSSDPWAARRVREALPAVFAELGDDAAARRYVTELWLAAGTRADLLALIALAGPLVPHQPELPQQIHASFAWVEEMLLAV